LIENGKLTESVSFLKEGIALSDDINDLPHQATFNLRLGQVLTYTGRLKDAQVWINKTKNILGNVDYQILEGLLNLQQAYSAYYIGNYNKAITLVKNSIDVGKELNDNRIMLDSYLLNCRLNPSKENIDTIKILSDEQHNHRVKNLVEYILIENHLSQDKIEIADNIYGNIDSQENRFDEDIEYSYILTTSAMLKHQKNDFQAAKELAIKAVELSKETDLKFNLIDSLTLLGNINYSNGDYENCFDNYKEALTVAKFIISNLPNENDQKIFSQKPVIKKLSEEIKKLSSILST
jgi:tetratricopeptide (TPR) repeat protein